MKRTPHVCEFTAFSMCITAQGAYIQALDPDTSLFVSASPGFVFLGWLTRITTALYLTANAFKDAANLACARFSSSEDVNALIMFLYTLGFPIFNRGVDYLFIRMRDPDAWHFVMRSFTAKLLPKWNSRYTFMQLLAYLARYCHKLCLESCLILVRYLQDKLFQTEECYDLCNTVSSKHR